MADDPKKAVQQIIHEHPEFITDDTAKHLKNLMIYGTSILYQKHEKVPGEVYGKGPVNVPEGDEGSGP